MKKRKVKHYSGIGGQAVLEGVMMKNKDMYAVAVRKPNGEIAVEIDEYHGLAYGSKLLSIPFVRGIFVFIDSLILGLKSLNFSSSFYEEAPEKPSKLDEELDVVSGGHEDTFLMVVTTIISFLFAIGLFVSATNPRGGRVGNGNLDDDVFDIGDAVGPSAHDDCGRVGCQNDLC